MTESNPRFLGLKADVLYRIELGFAIIDDGAQLVRMQRVAFERVLSHVLAGSTSLPDEVVAIVKQHPTVFESFDDREQARSSLAEKEI